MLLGFPGLPRYVSPAGWRGPGWDWSASERILANQPFWGVAGSLCQQFILPLAQRDLMTQNMYTVMGGI